MPRAWRETVERFGADAQRLLIARFGGDEFVVVLRHAVGPLLRHADAQRLRRGFRAADHAGRARVLRGAERRPRGLSRTMARTCPPCCKHADTAMYQSRAGSTGAVASYSAAMSSRMRDSSSWKAACVAPFTTIC